jgi:type 1 glutamine amidotransferase
MHSLIGTVNAALLLAALAAPVLGAEAPRVAVYSHTAAYRHESIEAGVRMLEALGATHGFGVEHGEDPAWFEAQDLAQYSAIVWLNTSGDALTPNGKAAFAAYVENGGGYVGIHAAADTEYGWPWYGELLGCGAWFRSHPQIQPARIVVEDAAHASTRHLPANLVLTDEWYNYRANPAACTHVLLELDETSYASGDGAMGASHPIAWAHAVGRGRAWYTGLGHPSELYALPEFRAHVLCGLLWAARLSD